jgi:hypothetical protein
MIVTNYIFLFFTAFALLRGKSRYRLKKNNALDFKQGEVIEIR